MYGAKITEVRPKFVQRNDRLSCLPATFLFFHVFYEIYWNIIVLHSGMYYNHIYLFRPLFSIIWLISEVTYRNTKISKWYNFPPTRDNWPSDLKQLVFQCSPKFPTFNPCLACNCIRITKRRPNLDATFCCNFPTIELKYWNGATFCLFLLHMDKHSKT
jgi:hypothetical protein